MIEVRAAEVKDIHDIDIQDAQKGLLLCADADYAESLVLSKVAITILDGDEILAVIGAQEMWEGRGVVWSLLSKNARNHMAAITKICLSALETSMFWRLELHVEAGFVAGERWARMLGFKKDCYLARFLPNGNDATLWSRLY